MLQEILSSRRVPALAPRDQSIAFFRENLYGASPDPVPVSARLAEPVATIFDGEGMLESLILEIKTPKGPYALPFELARPTDAKKPPLFLFISFKPFSEDDKTPYREIIESGYAIARFNYNDAATDERDVWNGLLTMFPYDERASWRKIGAWAYAASRIMDYLVTRDDLDTARAAVIGHSRLGKTALWCAAQDERFTMSIAVQSGCGGAAINRGKIGEELKVMTKSFPDWFCGNFQTYAHQAPQHPFDQHDLIAAIAPRRVYVCSAIEDEWADPASEYLACVAASPAYEKMGARGFISADRLPAIGDSFHEGSIGYHLRDGVHALEPRDWMEAIAYRKRHGI